MIQLIIQIFISSFFIINIALIFRKIVKENKKNGYKTDNIILCGIIFEILFIIACFVDISHIKY